MFLIQYDPTGMWVQYHDEVNHWHFFTFLPCQPITECQADEKSDWFLGALRD